MIAQQFIIEHKHRQMAGFHSSLADFTLGNGEAVDAAIVCSHPNMSLYCLDDAERRAIFVELPQDVDLGQAPFVYQTQYDQAQCVIAVPYEEFRRLAGTLPAVEHLIMVYITGRSGSTLLSHLFNQLESTLSLAEPDVASHFVHMRSPGGTRDAELRELLDCTVRFLCKPTAFKTPSICAIKLRNEGTQVMDLYQSTFPQVKNLFLYRDAIGYVRSFYRIFARDGFPDQMPVAEFLDLWGQVGHYDYTRLIACLDAGTTMISIPQALAVWWLATIEWYLAKYEQGLPVLAIRYEDLNAKREQVVAEVFRHCGLPLEQAQATLGVFDRDAQAGTALARDNPREGNSLQLSAEQHESVIRIVQRHPVIRDVNFRVPGTLQV